VVLDGYWTRPEPLKVSSRAAKIATIFRSRTSARLYICDTLRERLAQDLKDMAAALGQCIQEEHAMVGQRHVARHRHMPAPISPTSEIV
jgi:hypothetical protein